MKFFIKEARERAGISQAQLAESIGVNATTLSGYETGRHDPKSDTLILIAKVCSTTVDYLLGTEPVQSNPTQNSLDFARKYEALDEWGKRAVDAIMDIETRRCQQDIESLLDKAEEAETRRRKVTG
jgi:transcriptional regulator with XRE-family HTH domain